MKSRSRHLLFLFALLFCLATAIASPAQSFTNLFTFNGSNGSKPTALLVQGLDGNFYGTTTSGGLYTGPCFAAGCGTVFKITPTGILTTLYEFCSQANCADGWSPYSPLVQGADGNFYGTTNTGGSSNAGTIFRITPTGVLTTAHNFAGADGSAPFGGLLLATDGNFYGTTQAGGANYDDLCSGGCGTVFTMTPGGTVTTLYSFCSQPSCADGHLPGSLVQGADGSLYGTTSQGGSNGFDYGTVFKVTSVGTFTTLHSFDGYPEGWDPVAGLVQGSDGNLYGTTIWGGTGDGSPGTLFKISPGGTLTTLHNFSGYPDGGNPIAPLIQATDGNFYGTASDGGVEGFGTVFEINSAGKLTVLYSFKGTDGEMPYAGLLQATDGNFYGTTATTVNCSSGLCGTVFELSTGLPPFVVTQPTIGAVGASVTILGTNLTGATNVTFNGTPATILSNTGSAITTSVPAGATTGRVQVTVGDNNLMSNADFQVVGPIQLVPVAPCRLVDTRKGNPIQGGTSQNFTIPQLGGCGIPASAAAYSLNVTVVPRKTLGYLTIWPEGEIQPHVSTMNSPDGRTKANAAIVPAGANEAVSVYVTDTTDVILDIDGYFTAPSSQTYEFYPLTPCRVVDTRAGSNEPQGLGPPSLSAQQQRDLPILSSSCLKGITNPLAYSFNVTVVPNPAGQPLGYLTVWPTNQSQPVVSTLNNPTATVVANAAIVPAAPNGDIDVYAYNSTDLIIDINGYFAAPGQSGLSLYPVAPCRVLDTRNNNGKPFMDEKTVNVVGSTCAPPSSAQAYVFNATVVPPGQMPYLTLWADGQPQPTVSTLNAYDGFITSNMAIVPTTNGSIDAYAAALTHLILDISGYFAP